MYYTKCWMSNIPASSYLISDPSFVLQYSSKVTPNQYNREIQAESLGYILHQNRGISNEKSMCITLLTVSTPLKSLFFEEISFYQHEIS